MRTRKWSIQTVLAILAMVAAVGPASVARSEEGKAKTEPAKDDAEKKASAKPKSKDKAKSDPKEADAAGKAKTPNPRENAEESTKNDGPVESKDVLARAQKVEDADVLHVLLGWKELEPAYRGSMDPRGKARTKDEAAALARTVLARAKKGEDFRALMKELSEDPGSAATGRTYTATPIAQLVEPFKLLSLRLDLGETGIVETQYGYHVIQRVR